MNLKWITINERLKNGLKLINNLSTKKFQLLLLHIINAKSEDLFTEDEFDKLKNSLKLSEDSLQLLIQTILHIYRQSIKVILKPTILYKQLCENLCLDEEKSEEFVKVWCHQTNQDFGDFSNRLKLKDLSWELNMQGADKINNKQSLPIARVQFELTKSINTSEKKKIVVEFDQSELLQFYNNLEKIQIKMDSINNVGN